jgi:RimJ/RimL family protein N-acetyltransferase
MPPKAARRRIRNGPSPREQRKKTTIERATRSVPPDTARLSFRELNADDTESLLVIFSDPVAMEFYPATKNLQETRDWIQRCLLNYEKFGHCFWAVLLRDTGEFIGQCGILYQDLQNRPENEIGYLLQRRFWGQGYATEAAAACRNFAFTHFLYHYVVSYIDPRNTRSLAVAKRIGMTLEQSLAAHENAWQKPIDVYSINNPRSRP